MRKQIKTKKFKKETKSKREFSSTEKNLWGFVGTVLFYLRRKCSSCILVRRGRVLLGKYFFWSCFLETLWLCSLSTYWSHPERLYFAFVHVAFKSWNPALWEHIVLAWENDISSIFLGLLWSTTEYLCSAETKLKTFHCFFYYFKCYTIYNCVIPLPGILQ